MNAGRTKAVPSGIRRSGVMRSRDLERMGLARPEVAALAASGTLQRVARGIYIPAGHQLTERHSLAVACTRVPHGIVCLLSALAFHGLTVQNPSEVWMAIAPSSRKPADGVPPLRIVRFSGNALARGIEFHRSEGVRIRVYSVAKTVADLFKYRNKIGTDVAVEALRETLRMRRATIDELMRSAKVCRVGRVMSPYLEALQ
jgi:predicted transcriptional regulator of viral defense system